MDVRLQEKNHVGKGLKRGLWVENGRSWGERGDQACMYGCQRMLQSAKGILAAFISSGLRTTTTLSSPGA